MSFFSLAVLVPWVISHGYFIYFIIAVIEGTTITVAAGVAAGFGYFNIFIVILISIAGDLIADVLWYFLGYYGRKSIIERHGHRFGLTKERMEKFDKMVHTNFRKTMFVVKISPVIPVPGLIAIGASRGPLKKFIEMSALVTVPKSTFFALLGFFSWKAYAYLNNTIKNGSYIVGGLVLVVLIIYFAYQKITSRITKEVSL
jgi:membrane protein DedA with SNARE-associated domain